MNRVLLGLMVTAAIAVPASAQNFAGSGFAVSPDTRNLRVVQPGPPGSAVVPGFGGHHHHVRVGDHLFVGGFYGSGYYDYGDYDGNRSFDPDKWNDWWHQRPGRAFPRWVWRNQNCTEDRMWWSGTGWRCTP